MQIFHIDNNLNISCSKFFTKQINKNEINSLNCIHNYENLEERYDLSISDEIDEFLYDVRQDNSNLNILTNKLEKIQNKQNNDDFKYGQNNFKIKSSLPSDPSTQLLKRLVVASVQFEITQIISSANRALATMKMAAGICDSEYSGNIRTAIKKLEKIINRCEVKSMNLKNEENLRAKQKAAEKRKQEKLKQDLIKKLDEKVRRRKIIETGWLKEISYGILNKKYIIKNNKFKDAQKEDYDSHSIEVEIQNNIDLQYVKSIESQVPNIEQMQTIPDADVASEIFCEETWSAE